jgi:sorbitol/mannitol transport system substrate-binding protein
VKEYAAKLHDPAHQVYGVCLRGLPGWGENMAFLSTLVNAYGGAWFDAKNRPSIDSKPWREAVNYYVDLLSTYGPPSPEKNGYGENLKLFAEGHCGMWIDATVSMTSVLDPKTSKVASTVAFAPAPIVKPGRFGTHWVWTWSWAVPRSSKKQALAREFALWATSKDYIQLVAKEKGWLAVPPGTRYSTYASEGYQKALPSGAVVKREIETALDGAPVELGRPKTAAQFVMTPEFTAFGTSTGINVALALQKKLTVDEALKRSNDETRRVMTSEAKPNVRHAGTKKQKK